MLWINYCSVLLSNQSPIDWESSWPRFICGSIIVTKFLQLVCKIWPLEFDQNIPHSICQSDQNIPQLYLYDPYPASSVEIVMIGRPEVLEPLGVRDRPLRPTTWFGQRWPNQNIQLLNQACMYSFSFIHLFLCVKKGTMYSLYLIHC